MISFIKKIIDIFKISKITFTNPKKNELIVFDDYSLRDLMNVLDNRNYFLLISRASRNKIIFITPTIILKILQNLKKNLFTSYLIALIEVIKPKAVITSIDNSFKFHIIAKHFHSKDIKFIGVQNAARYDFIEHEFALKHKKINKNPCEHFYVPYYFCYGSYEEKEIRKRGFYVKKFLKYGSIRLSNYLEYIKKNNVKIRRNYYDISVLSGYSVDKDNFFKIKGMDEKWAINIKYAINFCKENDLKFIFITKRPKGYAQNIEFTYFKKHLTKSEFDYLEQNSTIPDRINFVSYKAIHESNVVTGFVSTMLRDKLALNGKILACNFTKYDMWDFPIKKFCFLKNPSYELYCERLKLIHSLDNKSFFGSIENTQLINVDEKKLTFDHINNFLDKI